MAKVPRHVRGSVVAALLTAITSSTVPVDARVYLPPLREIVTESDFIGVVTISSVRPSPLAAMPEEQRGAGYLRVARANIIEALKTPRNQTEMMIDFDTGLAGPNDLYSPGETWLVCLKEVPGGSFGTYRRFQVRGNVVLYWPPESATETPLEKVRAQILSLLKK